MLYDFGTVDFYIEDEVMFVYVQKDKSILMDKYIRGMCAMVL